MLTALYVFHSTHFVNAGWKHTISTFTFLFSFVPTALD